MDAEKEATCVTVQLTRDLAQGLQTQLEYDTRKDGSRGRALLTAVGPTLRTGDRLEWIQGCQDLRIDITALPENITVFVQTRPNVSFDVLVCSVFLRRLWGRPAC